MLHITVVTLYQQLSTATVFWVSRLTLIEAKLCLHNVINLCYTLTLEKNMSGCSLCQNIVFQS